MVIQLARLGDLVQTLPLLAALKSNIGLRLTLVLDRRVAEGARLAASADEIIPLDLPEMERECRQNGILESYGSLAAGLSPLRKGYFDIVYNLNCSPLNAAIISQVNHFRCEGFIPSDSPGEFRHSAPFRVMFNQGRHRRTARVHLADLFRKLADDSVSGFQAVWHIEEKAVAFGGTAVRTLKDRGAVKIVALHTGAGAEIRRWGDDKFLRLMKALHQKTECGFILVGKRGESSALLQRISSECGEILDLSGKTGIDSLAGTLSQVDLMIGADSGPLQLAAAAGTKTLGLFFASAFAFETGQIGDGHYIIQAFPDCAPCLEDAPDCQDIHCRNSISPDDAAQIAGKILAEQTDDFSDIKLPPKTVLLESRVDERGQTYSRRAGEDDFDGDDFYRGMWLELCRESGSNSPLSPADIAEVEAMMNRLAGDSRLQALAHHYFLARADVGAAAAAWQILEAMEKLRLFPMVKSTAE